MGRKQTSARGTGFFVEAKVEPEAAIAFLRLNSSLTCFGKQRILLNAESQGVGHGAVCAGEYRVCARGRQTD
jgi:hypothetical protein